VAAGQEMPREREKEREIWRKREKYRERAGMQTTCKKKMGERVQKVVLVGVTTK
jgi:hypothetical protein